MMFKEANSCIITLPSVSRKAVPPFAFDTQTQNTRTVHTRQSTYSTTVMIAQTKIATIPTARQTSETTTAQSTQKSHDHQLQLSSSAIPIPCTQLRVQQPTAGIP